MTGSQQRISQALAQNFRASEETSIRGAIFYDVGGRFLVLSTLCLIFIIWFFPFLKAMIAALTLAFSAMLLSELLGAQRKIFTISKTRRHLAKLLAIVFGSFSLFLALMAMLSREMVVFSIVAIVYGLDTLCLLAVIYGIRNPIGENEK